VETATQHLTKTYPNAEAKGSTVDVSNPDNLTSWVKSCAEEGSGKIDVVIANVSAISADDTRESWKKSFETDILGTQVMIQAALPYLEKTKGNIVTIASVSGRDIDFTAPGPYGSLKAALIHYTASLAHTLAPKGIRANTVSPGNIYIADGVWGEIERGVPELFKKQWEKNPMGRMGKPEEVADAVLFVSSNERASFVSGANLVVDGALCTGVQF
jgi:3-oxoacyl-[acyl-carrier protein] reductase